MEMLKVMPKRYRLDSNESGAVFFEDRLWLMDGDVGMCPVNQKIHDPETGNVRVVEGTLFVYHVNVEIKIEHETDFIDVDLGAEEKARLETKIESPIKAQPLSEISTDTFIDPTSERLIKIKSQDSEEGRFICFDLITGVEKKYNCNCPVDPVHVTIIIHPEMGMSGFLPGRCRDREIWENT